MNSRRRNPLMAALLAFPAFYLGGLAFTLHGGPCTAACHSSAFWPVALGGPLVVGFLVAAFPKVGLVDHPEGEGASLPLDAERSS